MKRAIGFGLLWWLIVFVEVSIVGFTPGLASQGEFGFTLLPKGMIVHFVLLIVLSAFLGWLYSRKSAVSIGSAARAALVIAIVGLLLDGLITVPFFVKSYGHYYSKWTLWTGLVIFFLIFVMACARKRPGLRGMAAE